jgi:hypothetical protein
MGKKTDKLHRLVKKLVSRYGVDDVDVMRLRAELDVLVAKEATTLERRESPQSNIDFRSATRRLYHASTGGDSH